MDHDLRIPRLSTEVGRQETLAAPAIRHTRSRRIRNAIPWMAIATWTTYLIVLCMLAGSGVAIKCYVCNSYSDLYCSENWALGDLAEEVQPIACDDTYEAQYCVKTTGMYQGEIGTQRFCSAKHLGNYCDWNSRPGDLNEGGAKREYRACIYTCSGDGCNSAPGRRLRLRDTLPAAALSLLVVAVARCVHFNLSA